MRYEELLLYKEVMKSIRFGKFLNFDYAFNGFVFLYNKKIYLFIENRDNNKHNRKFTHFFTIIEKNDYYELILGLITKKDVYMKYIDEWMWIDLKKEKNSKKPTIDRVKKIEHVKNNLSSLMMKDIEESTIVYYMNDLEKTYLLHNLNRYEIISNDCLVKSFKEVFNEYIETNKILFASQAEKIVVTYMIMQDFANAEYEKETLLAFPYLFELEDSIQVIDENYLYRNHKKWFSNLDTLYKGLIKEKQSSLLKETQLYYTGNQTFNILKNTLPGRITLKKSGIF